MPDWTWTITGPAGSTELTRARDRKLAFRRRESAEASFAINGRHTQAAFIEELISDVTVRRDGRKIFRGRVGQTSDDVDAKSHTMTVGVGDYRALLDARILYPTDTLTYPFSDAGVIAGDVLDTVQTRDGGDLGITPGVGIPAGTIAADVEFAPGQSAAAAIDAVAGLDPVDGGFDWEVDADLALNVYPAGRGQTRTLILEYGGSVASFRRVVDPRTYANVVRLSGATTSHLVQATDLDERPEGRWESQVGDQDLVDPQQVISQAARVLDERQTIRPSWAVTLRKGWWQGPDHLWLGDTARLRVLSGRLDVAVDARVEEVGITLDGKGSESVELTLDLSFAAVARRIAAVDRRLRDLERV